jgi:predicted metallopeptidase
MKLVDCARVIRSKNAGPTTLSLDLMFEDDARYQHALRSPSLTREAIAPLYGVPGEMVQVIPYAPALAIKIVLPRRTIAGDPGDKDVYGAQQHGPLLGIEL